MAQSSDRRRFALLHPESLRVLGQRSLPAEGVSLSLAADSERMIVFNWQSNAWASLDLGSLPPALGPLNQFDFQAPTSGITFHGRDSLTIQYSMSAVTGQRRVLMIPVVEPGQAYAEPDLSRLSTFAADEMFEQFHAYYDEASYGLLDMQFDFFGQDLLSPATPLVLPRAIRSYFNPPFEPGGLHASENLGPGTFDLYLDGSESMGLTVNPIQGPNTDLEVPFCALGLTAVHDTFPTITFTGSETAGLRETLGDGSFFDLNLQFPAESFEFTSDNFATRLNELADYLLGVVQAAEDAAGVPGGGQRVTSVACRRIRVDGQEFGELQTNFAFNSSAAGKGRLSILGHMGLTSIGFDDDIRGEFTLPGDESDLAAYLDRALVQAQVDAGLALGSYQLGATEVSMDGTVLNIDILLNEEFGGKDSNISLDGSPSGLSDFGLNDADPVDGSDTNKDDANALRDSQDLLNDVLTLLLDAIGGPGEISQLEPYSAIFIGFVIPAAGGTVDPWSVGQPDVSGLRMFARNMTAYYKPDDSVQLQNRFIGTFLGSTAGNATAIHELGHSIGYGDQYYQTSHRDDLLYLDDWDLMDNDDNLPHMGGYHKLSSGWIDPNRVIGVPRPEPDGPIAPEAVLVPIEYWYEGIEDVVRAAFPADAPDVYQLMRVDLGGDGVQFALIEARDTGVRFSQSLPAAPAVLVTNCLDPEDDTRYAENTLYRRRVHRLNDPALLANTGDSFNLATAPELPAKGVSVTIVDRRDVVLPFATIRCFHVRANVEQADYIDLCFTDATPDWKSPDLWVDWPGDNDDPEVPRLYPIGEPLDQGETVRVPPEGEEPERHWVVARVFNKGKGNVEARDVLVRLKAKDPFGGGDADAFQTVRTETIPVVANGENVPVAFRWDVAPGSREHVCLRAEIEDWTIPQGSDGEALASDDTFVSNNWAQKNVFDFVVRESSPFEKVNFPFGVSNSGVLPESAILEPENLPRGMTLEVRPRRMVIPPGETGIFQCTLSLDQEIIHAGCRNDRAFVIYALRETGHALVRWGGCKIVVRPRIATTTTIGGMWSANTLDLSGTVSPSPASGSVRLRLEFENQPPQWISVPLQAGGAYHFQTDTSLPAGARVWALARYEGNQELAPSESKRLRLDNAFIP